MHETAHIKNQSELQYTRDKRGKCSRSNELPIQQKTSVTGTYLPVSLSVPLSGSAVAEILHIFCLMVKLHSDAHS